MMTLYTIGHSNHSEERFVSLLQMNDITAVADVRSAPYSRYTPQFNKESLGKALGANRIAYVFLGNYLGARPNDPLCYRNGTIDFARLCQMDYFQEGLERLRAGAKRFNLAIMCSEKDPIECHRMILVCRHLRAADTAIKHILENGALEDNQAAEQRLMAHLKMAPADLFMSSDELAEEAYDKQGARIAYHDDPESRQADKFAQL
jgi:uncharacterized protein (DUF488 family)